MYIKLIIYFLKNRTSKKWFLSRDHMMISNIFGIFRSYSGDYGLRFPATIAISIGEVTVSLNGHVKLDKLVDFTFNNL